MKIIATSVLLLAATASAGESSLRLGRELAPKGMAYDWRCCDQYDDTDEATCTAPIDDSVCNRTNLKPKLSAKFSFNGCVWDASTGDCSHDDNSDDRRRELKPGGQGKAKGVAKAKGIGYYCCRAGDGEPDNAAAATACAAIDGSADECINSTYGSEFNECVYDLVTGDCDHIDNSSE